MSVLRDVIADSFPHVGILHNALRTACTVDFTLKQIWRSDESPRSDSTDKSMQKRECIARMYRMALYSDLQIYFFK